MSSSSGPPRTVSAIRSIGRAVTRYRARRPGMPAPVSQLSSRLPSRSCMACGACMKSMPPAAGGVSTTTRSQSPLSANSAICSPAA